MRTVHLFVVLMAVPLAACSEAQHGREGAMTSDAGQAVRHNIAAQLVNPGAPGGNGTFVTDGERAYRALDRYRKGSVIPPTSASPTQSGAAGSDSTDTGTASGNQNTP
jgi:type IV pilus biogenesis protein CpaD/CtpE